MATLKTTNGHDFEVDDNLADYVSKFNWHMEFRPSGQVYIAANICGRKVRLHRFLRVLFGSYCVDHIDRNGRNNKLENLRICDTSGNAINKVFENQTGFRGVFQNSKNSWSASLLKKGKRFTRRGFKSPEEAAKAYDEMALEHHGEYAVLNFRKTPGLSFDETKKINRKGVDLNG